MSDETVAREALTDRQRARRLARHRALWRAALACLPALVALAASLAFDDLHRRRVAALTAGAQAVELTGIRPGVASEVPGRDGAPPLRIRVSGRATARPSVERLGPGPLPPPVALTEPLGSRVRMLTLGGRWIALIEYDWMMRAATLRLDTPAGDAQPARRLPERVDDVLRDARGRVLLVGGRAVVRLDEQGREVLARRRQLDWLMGGWLLALFCVIGLRLAREGRIELAVIDLPLVVGGAVIGFALGA